MKDCFLARPSEDCVRLVAVTADAYAEWRAGQDERTRRWLDANGFLAARDRHCLVPGEDGRPSAVVAGVSDRRDPWCLAGLPFALPEGKYRLNEDWNGADATRASIGWGLGAYQFARYKRPRRAPAQLALHPGADAALIDHQVDAVWLARDLINTPAEDMMPAQLGECVVALAEETGASVTQIEGDALLGENYPAIHTVGRASDHEPRLIDLRWGERSAPRVTLVGKGVCFDSGGLDLKSAKGMRLMKKDMGGAAHAIALAKLTMAQALPIRLRLLVPAVENAVSGNAYRPGDIIRTRQGLTVEIDNTDAEGRVILCDALAEASEERPEVLIDFATLTGAARVAVGAELPALFCNDDEVAAAMLEASREAADEVWRLPLHAPYRDLIDSKAADIVNSAATPYGGAITAALFLERFVGDSIAWAHLDIMGWNVRSRPGRPEGGEAMGLRAMFEYLTRRYGR